MGWPGAGGRPDLQDLGELPAVPELKGGLAQALQAAPDLLRLLLQGGLEVQASQAGFVFGNREHLSRGKARTHPPHQDTHRPTAAWGGGQLAARHSLKKNKHNPNISTKKAAQSHLPWAPGGNGNSEAPARWQ